MTKQIIWATDGNFYYRISEGTGDNLSQEDIDDGYVDYIYYDYYATLEDIKEDNTYDGGMILLKKFYQDMTEEEILKTVAEFEDTELKEIQSWVHPSFFFTIRYRA